MRRILISQASHRIFPGLKTNNLLGMFEHPDFPLDGEKFGIKKGEHIPAGKVLEYLESFVQTAGISAFLRLNTKVQVIEQDDERGWKVHCTPSAQDQAYQIHASKLIIATGSTSSPSKPQNPTSALFTPPVIHAKDFPSHFSSIARPSSHTLVIGSGKSAWDISYACATQPTSTVTMLIRPSGNGPVLMTPSHVTPFKLWLEKLVFTRFFGLFSPCPWAQTTGPEGWIRAFLHRTWLGRKIVSGYWKVLGDDAIALNRMNEHPETKKLVPWRGAFEVGNALSICNYPINFFDLVRQGRVKVVIDEVKGFEDGQAVRLMSGEKIHVDAVVCATGWKMGRSIIFKPVGLESEMGLPTVRTTRQFILLNY